MEKPRSLDQVRQIVRMKHYSIRTEKAYAEWIKSFILFHNKRHPAEMGKEEIQKPAASSRPAAIPFVIVSPPICFKMAMISEPSRNCSAIKI